MSNNTEPKMVTLREPFFGQRDYAWMMATFILTPATAAALAFTGYIHTNPVIATIDGVLVAFMYVGFRVVNAMRRLRLYKRALAQQQKAEFESE